ncbi:hypothetical protein C7271_15945 [filamentous cyanobacterium CCP5]|nr:hypothetical protein C7271_15945 [filamentous cyanobacterium CCP5]
MASLRIYPLMADQPFIFISYRRSDSISEAGRIYDSLAARFGRECIFKDVFDIPYGVDFAEHLDKAVGQCQVLLAIIGNSWLNATDNEGRRLDNPEDFVRLEISAALKRNILVIPVLVNGAVMPRTKDLPDELKPLARRNAAPVRHDPDYHDDMNRLVEIIRDRFQPTSTPAPGPQAGRAIQSQTQSAPDSLVTPAVLTVINGSLSLVNAIVNYLLAIWDDWEGITVGAILLVLSLGAAYGLLRRQAWSWLATLGVQVLAILVSLALMLYYNNLSYEISLEEEGFLIGPGLNVMVPIMGLVVLIWLFRPKVRRLLKRNQLR